MVYGRINLEKKYIKASVFKLLVISQNLGNKNKIMFSGSWHNAIYIYNVISVLGPAIRTITANLNLNIVHG